ncbi:MAG: SH3 domain-containing protein [Anaerolineae bacterium]|nr:SH3 domain-containing protein [Anaerolineae bacterium]
MKDQEELEPALDAEERLRRMRTRRSTPVLPLAWLPVVLIAVAVGVLFWWLTQTIQPDRERAVGTPPALAIGTALPKAAAGATLPPTAGLMVGEILKNRTRYTNEQISVTGRYRARDVKGELKGQPALTVNDWVLSDGTSAIWVTGRGPADLSLAGDRDIDTPLLVEGTLREVAGKLVLDARTVIVAGRPPGVATGGTPTAGGTPAASGGIQPGGYVKVTGTGGSQLSFRSGPGTSFGRVTDQPLLPDGAQLKVLEGPKQADDGKAWWRLQSDKGVIGWAAQEFLEPAPAP